MANQIITLSNNDVILRSRSNSKYIIDNNVYSQDVNQLNNRLFNIDEYA